MLFNAPEFLLAFLPVVLVGFYLLGSTGRPFLAQGWLVATSLFFYAWWRLGFLPLLLISIVWNFGFGMALARRPSKWLLTVAIAGNLGALGWYKYAGFFAQAANDLAGAGIPVPHVLLPLAISFYTFQQIAYLVDVHNGETHEISLMRYALFVVFFPQLIAGPIVHHGEMLDQFRKARTYRPEVNNLLLGLAAFGIGLFKKVCLADPLSGGASLAFGPAAQGLAPGFVDAWLGSIAYALQLYFDFSGYSDMAIGLGLMFGIRLPVNFASPYKSASIIEFWTRWHMTLTRFLVSYLYNPISMALTRRRMRAGKKPLQRSSPAPGPFLVLLAFPTMVTMTLAGIWHGAGWQFLVFGVLHGVLLVTNHAWRALRHVAGLRQSFGLPGRIAGIAVTFLAVTVTLVFFKADSLEHALTVVRGMAGFGGEVEFVARRVTGVDPSAMNLLQFLAWRLTSFHGMLTMIGLFIVWALPNTPRYIELVASGVERQVAAARKVVRWPLIPLHRLASLQIRPDFLQGSVVGALLSFALLRALSVAPSEFLYFTF